MKKVLLLGTVACVMLAFTSCKSSESAYRKAYEKAKQQELTETQPTASPVVRTETAVVQPSAPAAQPAPVAGVRQERVSVVSGSNALKDYSVVCGSFTVKANADNLKDWLSGQGYAPVVVYSAEARPNPSYRVIVSTFDAYDAAAAARDAFKRKYANREDFQGSWLLYRLR
ncbi:MAG: SPOR domain-containing protein [Prevotellaceae bacterium]|jgi:cell division protein FtsN|nr:SPOR domain-containing protein [Prevotellaceae bacterium]